jgi:hypothetical protein
MSTTPAPPTETPPFTTLHWDSIMPSANGSIAKLFSQVTEDAQMEDANHMADFISKQDDTSSLNLDTSLVPFLIAIPGNTCKKVHIIFRVGTGFGLKGIHENPLQDNILTLTGEAEASINIPAALILSEYTLKTVAHKVPSQEEFDAERTESTTANTPNEAPYWFKATDLGGEAEVSPAVPVLAFLVYDGFDMDIDPVVIYERIKAIPNHDEVLQATLVLLMPFLFATVVKTTKKDQSIRVPDRVFLTQPTALANSWKKSCLQQIFPTLINRQTPPMTTATASAATATQPDADFIVRIITATRAADNSNSNNNEDARFVNNKVEEDTSTLGLSATAFDKLAIIMTIVIVFEFLMHDYARTKIILIYYKLLLKIQL